MKKTLIIPIALFVLSLSSIVYAYGGSEILERLSAKFTDHAEIPEYSAYAVDFYSSKGVIAGYEDGNFGPNDSLTRAQLATILKRYEDYYDEKIGYVVDNKIAGAFYNLSYYENTSLENEVKWALALAQTGIKHVNVPGASLHDSAEEFLADNDTSKIESEEIPKGYEVYYWDNDIMYGGGYYVHNFYEGAIPNSGEIGEINLWYGPYHPDFLFAEDEILYTPE